MSIELLKKEMKDKIIRKIYLFYGTEEYLKKFYLKKLEDSLSIGEYIDLNKIVLNEVDRYEKIIDSCETYPVFSNKKLVIVKDSGLFKAKVSTNSQKSAPKNNDFLDYLKNIPEYVCLIFMEKEVDKRLSIVDFIKKNGVLVEFPVQPIDEICSWIVKVFKTHNKIIDKSIAIKLAGFGNGTMMEILQEIEKIVLFLDERQSVTIEDIELICVKSIKVKVFDLTDAVARKDGKSALRLLGELIESKEPLYKIFLMIARQIRQMLQIKLLTEKSVDSAQIAQMMGISVYVIKKLQSQSNMFSAKGLEEVYRKCNNIDLDIKNGRINEKIAIEILVSELG
jgi:DNA polymerase-3 subunit delta